MPPDNDQEVKLVALLDLDEEDQWIRAETPWGEPIEANNGGGTYRLLNDCTYAPLRYGDVVHAELGGDSRLQVTGIQSVVAGYWSLIYMPDDLEDIDVTSVTNQLTENGADGTSWGFGPLTVCWGPEISFDDILDIYVSVLPNGWQVAALFDADDRLEVLQSDIQFILEEYDPAEDEPIDYWAPEVSVWKKLGADTPELLA